MTPTRPLSFTSRTVGVVVALSLAAGCGSPAPHQGAPPTPDVTTAAGPSSLPRNLCPYLDPASVRGVLGVAASGPLSYDPQSTVSNCSANAGTHVLTVTLVQGRLAQQLLTSGVSQVGATVPVAGVGDQAWRDAAGRTVIALRAGVGCEALDFTTQAPPSADVEGALLGSICEKMFARA